MTDIVERVRITDAMLRAACDAERAHDGASPCHFCPERCGNEGLAAAICAALDEAAAENERLRAALKQAEEGLREAGAIYGADAVRAALGVGQ